jgi:hypothetical protein
MSACVCVCTSGYLYSSLESRCHVVDSVNQDEVPAREAFVDELLVRMCRHTDRVPRYRRRVHSVFDCLIYSNVSSIVVLHATQLIFCLVLYNRRQNSPPYPSHITHTHTHTHTYACEHTCILTCACRHTKAHIHTHTHIP